jgi:mono/diheme cytochrome c family protein
MTGVLASTAAFLLFLAACSGSPASISTGATAGSSSSSGSGAPAGTVSFSADVLPIFRSRCISCHGQGRISGGLDLSSYAALMAGSQHGAVVVAGSPDSSRVVQMVVQGKMPKRGPKLLATQIEILSNWVKAGAPDN